MNIANKLTMFRIILIPFFIISLYIFGVPSIAPALIFSVAALTDMLDGHLARSRNLVTTFGKFMDPIADKLLVISAQVLLVELGILPGWAVFIIISREIIISAFRIIAADKGKVIAASIYGKIKTVTQLVAVIMILLGLNFGMNLAIIVFYLSVIFTVLSGIDYIVKNISVLNIKDI